MPSNRALTRQPPMREKRTFLIGAVDIETKRLNGKLLMAQSYHENWLGAVRIFRTAENMLDDIFALPREILQKTFWYAHNAEYDWRYMIESFKGYDEYDFIPLERAHGKFFQINVVSKTEKDAKGRPVHITAFRDSFALYPRSLADFTRSFAWEFKKQDIGLAYTIFDPSNPVHVEYAKNDVLGLVAALINFDRVLYDNFHVHIRGTTASTAFSACLRFFPEGEYFDKPSPRAEAFFRKCYKGGVVQMNTKHDGTVSEEHEVVTFLDVNSSYAYAMRMGVPKGKPVETTEYMKGFPGFYYAKVEVPENAVLPIIGSRTDKGLVWAVGKFYAYITSDELEYARKFNITFDVEYGYYFPMGTSYCFSVFIDICEKLRAHYKGTPTETVIKLIQNSVYGRFGMKPEGREFIISSSPIDVSEWNFLFDDNNQPVENVYYKETTRDTNYMLPHFAAWITMRARIRLDELTEVLGREKVIYRDTDSCGYAGLLDEAKLVEKGMVSPAYGDFKV